MLNVCGGEIVIKFKYIIGISTHFRPGLHNPVCNLHCGVSILTRDLKTNILNVFTFFSDTETENLEVQLVVITSCDRFTF